MSQHLDSLQIGDFMEMKGPKGHLTYFGKGKFTVKQMRKPLEERQANHFGLIAGGTGITPIMQLVRAIFRDEKDNKTTMSVLYANQSKSNKKKVQSFNLFNTSTHSLQFYFLFILQQLKTISFFVKNLNHSLRNTQHASVFTTL